MRLPARGNLGDRPPRPGSPVWAAEEAQPRLRADGPIWASPEQLRALCHALLMALGVLGFIAAAVWFLSHRAPEMPDPAAEGLRQEQAILSE